LVFFSAGLDLFSQETGRRAQRSQARADCGLSPDARDVSIRDRGEIVRIIWYGETHPTVGEVKHLHQQTHEEYFIANSIKTEATINEP
jgi:hypothetical protein